MDMLKKQAIDMVGQENLDKMETIWLSCNKDAEVFKKKAKEAGFTYDQIMIFLEI